MSSHNPTPGSIVGVAQPVAPGSTLEGRLTDRYKQGIAPPHGFHYDSDSGTVVRDEPSFLSRHPWLYPLMGVGAGFGLAAAGVGAGSAAAGSAGALGPSTAGNIAATSAAAGSAPAGIAATGATAGAAGTGGGFGSFMASNAGGSLVNAGAAGLMAYGQYKSSEADRALNALVQAATLGQNQYNSDRNFNGQRATGVLNADPLGADQSFMQRNALMHAILPGINGQRSSPGDAGVRGAMGGGGGGGNYGLPANGFDPAMVESLWGSNPTMASISRRHQELMNLDPNAPNPNFNDYYGKGTPNVDRFNSLLTDYANNARTADQTSRDKYNAQFQALLDAILNTGRG